MQPFPEFFFKQSPFLEFLLKNSNFSIVLDFEATSASQKMGRPHHRQRRWSNVSKKFKLRARAKWEGPITANGGDGTSPGITILQPYNKWKRFQKAKNQGKNQKKQTNQSPPDEKAKKHWEKAKKQKNQNFQDHGWGDQAMVLEILFFLVFLLFPNVSLFFSSGGLCFFCFFWFFHWFFAFCAFFITRFKYDMCVSEGKAVMGPPRVLPSCNHTTSESDSKSKKPREKSKKQKKPKPSRWKNKKSIWKIKKQKNKISRTMAGVIKPWHLSIIWLIN